MRDFIVKMLTAYGGLSSKRFIAVFLTLIFGGGFITCIILNRDINTYIISMATLIGGCVGANVISKTIDTRTPSGNPPTGTKTSEDKQDE